jgi:hypothetical protein
MCPGSVLRTLRGDTEVGTSRAWDQPPITPVGHVSGGGVQDRYRIGEAEFEVTQPRVTCYRAGEGGSVAHPRRLRSWAGWALVPGAPQRPETDMWPR